MYYSRDVGEKFMRRLQKQERCLYTASHCYPNWEIWAKVWVVRAGRNGVYIEYFLEKGVVAIDWGEVGAIESTLSDVEIRRRFDEKWPTEKPRTRATWAAQVKRFLREVEEGDSVVTYDRGTRLYHIGIVRSPAALAARMVDDQERQEFVRNVDWTDTCPRDDLSASTRNSLGSIATFFRVSEEAAAELQRNLSEWGSASPSDEDMSPISDQLVWIQHIGRATNGKEQIRRGCGLGHQPNGAGTGGMRTHRAVGL